VAEALALAFRRWARVDWVTSGMEGLRLAATQAVALAIVEADISDMPPAGFAHALRLLRPDTPIALLGGPQEAEGTAEGDADAHFSKPIDLAALLAWVAEHLTQAPPGFPRVESPPVAWAVPRAHADIVRGVLEFIERHQPEGIPLAMIAQAAGVSRWHLCRMFKRITGLSIRQSLTRRRVQAAKELLLGSEMTILEVARRVGFRDVSHLDRVFRQWEGLTPSGYRRRAMLRAFGNGVAATRTSHLASSSPPSP